MMTGYWGAERVLDLFQNRLGRRSFDDEGSRIFILEIEQKRAFWH